MKNISLLALVSLLLSCSGSSQEEERGFQIYDLDQEFEEVELSLSDVMEDPELIFLETSEESLLDQFSYVIGEKYIVTLEREQILLFNREGNFIRKLASSGRGPGEFTMFYGFALDPQEEYLYLADYNRESSILAYKLSDGSYKEVKTPGRTFSVAFVDENTLLGVGSSNGPFSYFTVDIPTGEVATKDQEVAENITSSTVGSLLKGGDQIYMYQNDTLYTYTNFELIPKSTFSIKDKVDMTSLSSGYTFSIRTITADFTIISKYHMDITQSGGGFRVNSSNSQMICIDHNTNELFIPGPLKHEEAADISSSFISRSTFNNGMISLRYDAGEWLEIIESGDAESLPKNLISASEGLDYEDNPVLVVGKVKPLK